MLGGDRHFEPYVHLAGLTDDAALLSWGGFFFRPGAQGGTAAARAERPGDEEWMVVDDASLDALEPGRRESIGKRSEPYGTATVEVMDESGRVVATARTSALNHAWIEGLVPDTVYRYRLTVDGESWTERPHVDWGPGPDGRRALLSSGREYACRFRTHPAPTTRAPLAFAVLGDFGVGIRTDGEDARRQEALAGALERAVDAYGVRLVVTVGDNVYLGERGTGASGDEDDDWFFTFYQPYRYLLDRVPFYPSVGNHDASETEQSDDRAQLEDNYFLADRFGSGRESERRVVDPGLFYSFRYGADVELVGIDTTRPTPGEPRYFQHPHARAFLEEAFPAGDGGPAWRIPFSHHPTYCAGPQHGNTYGMESLLVPLFRRAGVRLALAGHEHAFQHSLADGIHYLVSGAGGKLRPERPTGFEAAHTRAWAARGHFLVVELERERALVWPVTAGDDGAPRLLTGETPDGRPWQGPIVIPH